MPYERQLQYKQHEIAELFGSVASESCVLEPILGMGDPFRFRNKIASPFAPGKLHVTKRGTGGRARAMGKGPRKDVLCGMYARGTHHIVPIDDCIVENESGRRIVSAVRSLMMRFGIEAYDEDAGTGVIRHVVVRVGHESGEVLVTLVSNVGMFPGAKNIARELVRRCPEITTVVLNVNMRKTNAILGSEEHVLYGPGFILDTLCGLSFRISSHSFYQVNAVQTEVLYRKAIELALDDAPADPDEISIMDAYCGTGTIGLAAASMAGNAHVVGVDKTESSIHDARQNALHNGIENATFVTADAGAYLRAQVAKGNRFDVLIMDPPRAGSTEEFLRAVVDSGVSRIVYVSCNPFTQVRDIELLQKMGFELRHIQPVDMFPHTDHVETVVLMSRKDT